MVPNELKTSMSDYTIYMDTAPQPAGYAGVALLTKYKPLAVTFGLGKF